jgi:hypothetical protein
VKEGRLVKYYDFNGHYTNKYTNDWLSKHYFFFRIEQRKN